MGRVLPTLQKRHADLALSAVQLDALNAVPLARPFGAALASAGLLPLRTTGVDILQINVGKRCNQTCRHCHVDAGPDRSEVMPRAVIEAIFAFVASSNIKVLDITGGAPELHPDFREIVARASEAGVRVMHRCNLTAVLLPNYSDIPALLAKHNVEVIASLPYFQARETNVQRGDGVFEESITSLKRFNELGYGRGEHTLNLVMNPVGTFLPGNQQQLEILWKNEMKRRYDVDFDHLYTITNMPISRFLEFLEEKGKTLEYMTRLVNAFNPQAAAGVMCRNTLSVGWDGTLYDCDFNQMLDLKVESRTPQTIFEASRAALEHRTIVIGPHCYGCTAGTGSSCGGALV